MGLPFRGCLSVFLFLFGGMRCASPDLRSLSPLPGSGAVPSPQVCFSPQENCLEALISFLKEARASLDLAAFDLTLDEVGHLLLVKQHQGVKVRVVLDKRQAKGKHSLSRVLMKGQVPLRFGRQRGVMHHKFVIVDGKALETGSFNYTHNASRSNQENQLYFWKDTPAHSEIIEAFRSQFEVLWKGGVSPL